MNLPLSSSSSSKAALPFLTDSTNPAFSRAIETCRATSPPIASMSSDYRDVSPTASTAAVAVTSGACYCFTAHRERLKIARNNLLLTILGNWAMSILWTEYVGLCFVNASFRHSESTALTSFRACFVAGPHSGTSQDLTFPSKT
jgi:hypothetical protein